MGVEALESLFWPWSAGAGVVPGAVSGFLVVLGVLGVPGGFQGWSSGPLGAGAGPGPGGVVLGGVGGALVQGGWEGGSWAGPWVLHGLVQNLGLGRVMGFS